MKTLDQFRNHPAVQEIILESDFGRRTYVINLKAGFATDNGGGQTSGTESTLAGVAAFLQSVAGDCSPCDLIALEQAGVVDPEEMTGTGSEAQHKANREWNEKARNENKPRS